MAQTNVGAGDARLTRREFSKLSAGIAALAAVSGVSGCGSLRESSAEEAAQFAEKVGSEGEWITAACWHNCGGRCLNKALVVDGTVIRQKTDDTHEDSPDYPQARSCVRGRSQRNLPATSRTTCWVPTTVRPRRRSGPASCAASRPRTSATSPTSCTPTKKWRSSAAGRSGASTIPTACPSCS